MTTRAEQLRDGKARERERKRAAGLVPVEVWCRPEQRQAVRRYVQSLAQPLNRGRKGV